MGRMSCHQLLRQTTVVRESPGSNASVPITPGRLSRNTLALWVWLVALSGWRPRRVSCTKRAVWNSFMAVHCLSRVEQGLAQHSPVSGRAPGGLTGSVALLAEAGVAQRSGNGEGVGGRAQGAPRS